MSVSQRKIGQPPVRALAGAVAAGRRFGSEVDVETITGISRRTLQKHRLLGRGFKFYRFGTRVLYDLDEVDQRIRAGAQPGDSPRGPGAFRGGRDKQ